MASSIGSSTSSMYSTSSNSSSSSSGALSSVSSKSTISDKESTISRLSADTMITFTTGSPYQMPPILDVLEAMEKRLGSLPSEVSKYNEKLKKLVANIYGKTMPLSEFCSHLGKDMYPYEGTNAHDHAEWEQRFVMSFIDERYLPTIRQADALGIPIGELIPELHEKAEKEYDENTVFSTPSCSEYQVYFTRHTGLSSQFIKDRMIGFASNAVGDRVGTKKELRGYIRDAIQDAIPYEDRETCTTEDRQMLEAHFLRLTLNISKVKTPTDSSSSS